MMTMKTIEKQLKPPSALEVIEAIQKLVDEHGNLPMVLIDPDTDWVMPIGINKKELDGRQIIAINSCYYKDPDGLVGEGFK